MLIRNKKSIFSILFFGICISLLTTLANCQQKSVVEMKKPLLPSKMMSGFKLEGTRLNPKSTASHKIYYFEAWENKAGIVNKVLLTVMVFDSRKKLDEEYHDLDEDRPDLRFVKGDPRFGKIGEVTWSRVRPNKDWADMVFIKKNTVVEISIYGNVKEHPEKTLGFLKKAASCIESKI